MEREPGDAFVEVGQTVEIDGHQVEILRTLADCIGTILYFRSDRDARLMPLALWPPEIAGNMAGHGGELMEAVFDPVDPDRSEIRVGFGSFMAEARTRTPVTVPVDRGRTARFERHLVEPRPAAIDVDGVMIEVTNARVGVLRGGIDLMMTGTDQSILACEIGWPHRVYAPHPGPGSPALWSDWHPRDSDVERRTTRGPDGMTTVSMSHSFTVTGKARRGGPRPPDRDRPDPPKAPDPVHVRGAPEGALITGVNAHQRSGRLGPLFELEHTVTHDAPSSESSGVELAIIGLYLFRFAGGRVVTVPLPRPDAEVDLTGTTFETDHGPVELIRWEPDGNVIPRLVVRTPSPWWYPDIRVLHRDQSVGLWMHPGHDGILAGGLPGMYEAAFQDPEGVRLALRLLGRPAPEVRIPIALSPPGS